MLTALLANSARFSGVATVAGVSSAFAASDLSAGPGIDGVSAAFSIDDLVSFQVGASAPVTGVSASFSVGTVGSAVDVDAPVTGVLASFKIGYLEVAGSAVATVTGVAATFSSAGPLSPDLTARIAGVGATFYQCVLAPVGQDCEAAAVDALITAVSASDELIDVVTASNESFAIVTASDHYDDDEVYPPWQ